MKKILLSLFVIFILFSCGNGKSSKINYFASEQDVLDYIEGTTFVQWPLGLRTTIYNGEIATVVSFSEQTAIVSIGFDMGDMLGRNVIHTEKFEIDRTTGTISQINE